MLHMHSCTPPLCHWTQRLVPAASLFPKTSCSLLVADAKLHIRRVDYTLNRNFSRDMLQTTTVSSTFVRLKQCLNIPSEKRVLCDQGRH